MDGPSTLDEHFAAGGNRHSLIVSTYFKGATNGQGLGTAGYSYEFVRQLFLPLLRRWGEVVFVRDAKKEVEAAGRAARARNCRPIHVGFVAFQDMHLSPSMPNVVVPAWEFPDIPNLAFDGNPQNDWVATSNRCDMVLAHVPFTAKALIRAGVTAPIREVPVPMPDVYFSVPGAQAAREVVLQASGYSFTGLDALPADPGQQGIPRLPAQRSHGKSLRSGFRGTLQLGKAAARRATPGFVWQTLQSFKREYRTAQAVRRSASQSSSPIALSGIVYTSIFNPGDARKNWGDLITGFIWAMKDYDDATLALKLITNDPEQVYSVVECYRRIATPHRCKIAIIQQYLSDEQMLQLLEASTYYLTTTRAEGNCLPLMNYLAAGRPGISPAHSAISDYFDERVGFVVDSHPEPSSWPQETRPKYRTTWARLVWPSLVEALRSSYRVAKHERRTYERLSNEAHSRMKSWLHEERVYPLLQDALDAVARSNWQSDGASRRAA
jgi:glycosyltransferase involved in cell wall biosynthesis